MVRQKASDQINHRNSSTTGKPKMERQPKRLGQDISKLPKSNQMPQKYARALSIPSGQRSLKSGIKDRDHQ
jgi:hypothetical protein